MPPTGTGCKAFTCRLISRWLGRVPGLGVEADDLTQEVFVVVIREISRVSASAGGIISSMAAAGDGEQGPQPSPDAGIDVPP